MVKRTFAGIKNPGDVICAWTQGRGVAKSVVESAADGLTGRMPPARSTVVPSLDRSFGRAYGVSLRQVSDRRTTNLHHPHHQTGRGLDSLSPSDRRLDFLSPLWRFQDFMTNGVQGDPYHHHLELPKLALAAGQVVTPVELSKLVGKSVY